MFNFYAFILGFGASLGLIQVLRFAPSPQKNTALQATLGMLIGALIGSRLMYVIFHPAYYSSFPEEIILFWQGGLTWVGAVLGGLTAFWLLKLTVRKTAAELAHLINPVILPFAATCWLAGWSTGVGYAAPSSAHSLLSIPIPDETGTLVNRFPLQLAAAFTLLLGMMGFEWLPPIIQSHSVSAILPSFYLCVHTFIFSIFRADPTPAFPGWRLESLAALAFSLFFFAAALILWIPTRHLTTPESLSQ